MVLVRLFKSYFNQAFFELLTYQHIKPFLPFKSNWAEAWWTPCSRIVDWNRHNKVRHSWVRFFLIRMFWSWLCRGWNFDAGGTAINQDWTLLAVLTANMMMRLTTERTIETRQRVIFYRRSNRKDCFSKFCFEIYCGFDYSMGKILIVSIMHNGFYLG